MFVWVAMTVVTVGWDYQRTEPPRRHRHLFARSEFHKTCAEIVDDIMAGSFPVRQPRNDSGAILSGGKGVNSKGQPRQVYEPLGDSRRGCDLLAGQREYALRFWPAFFDTT
jgi:hypothetical protein